MADFRQESAPKGGYPGIQFKRNLPNRGPSSVMIVLGGLAIIGVGFCVVNNTRRDDRYDIEPYFRFIF